jgi:ATP-dependent helicase/DNAse subunit B
MPITLITGPANAGKARAVLDAVSAHHARGEEPLLVVPTRADVERYRLELAERGLILGVRVERFGGLLAEVVRRAANSQRQLGALARERVIAVVAERALGVRRGHVRALGAFFAELEVERVSPGRLRGALGAWAAVDPAQQARAERLGECYEEYHRVLGELRRASPERRATAALDTLRRTPALWGGAPVLLYGFDDFTRLQLDTIETLGNLVGAPVTVSLAFEAGRTAFAGRAGTFQTLLPSVAEHRALGPRTEHYAPCARAALHHVERFLFEPGCPVGVGAGDAVRLLEGGDERAELELVAEQIGGLLGEGVAPEQIAVAHRSPEAIAELLGEVFRAHGIPYAVERRLRFDQTAVGRALLGMLRAALGREGRLEDLLAWLRAPGVLRLPELADELEARARRGGVETAVGARALWEAQHWPLEALERLREAAEGGPVALIERTLGELEWLFCAPRVRQAGVLGRDELPEGRALAVGRAALRELRELALTDRRTPAPALAPDAEELIAVLGNLELVVGDEPAVAAELAGTSAPGASAPGSAPAVGGAVAVLDPLALRARRVRALFLCGLQEGVFPAGARPEPLLSEDERRGLAQASGLLAAARGARPGDALAAERYLLYATVSRPRELLVLSWHTTDEDGLASARSLFVEDICDLFDLDLDRAGSLAGERTALGEVGGSDWGSGMGSPVGRRGASPARTAECSAQRPSGGGLAALRAEPVLAELRGRRLWSASALEAWAGCPVRWFVERQLRARDLDPEPEPLARGGLAHAALRDTLEGLRRETGSARLRPSELPRARRLLRAALAEREREYPLSVAPERVPGVRRRLGADLERYLEHAAAQESPLEPAHMELPFGFPDEPGGLPALDLGDGMLVRGRIDRVDVGSDGAAVVYDYKGAHAPEAGRWVRERSFQVALYMRAIAEPLGVRAVGGFYQPLSGRDLRARGLLAEDEGVELGCVRGDAREQTELEGILDEVLAAAREAATQVRDGALQARPGSCAFGEGGCMYPTICRCER